LDLLALKPDVHDIDIVEVVDHLFDAHRVRRGQGAIVEEAPNVAVGCGIDVDGEGG